MALKSFHVTFDTENDIDANDVIDALSIFFHKTKSIIVDDSTEHLMQ